ncbi:hypothetical protein F2Q69_00005008 [Brassica cretica]|uniref:Uncharacterized protein n=1 Tax=Brassica cretica TaxID=69181 RepID=A0A8S9P3G4_BRACR|nr:hypothetical protein F2Q69_00005008 [Brassica cretica]
MKEENFADTTSKQRAKVHLEITFEFWKGTTSSTTISFLLQSSSLLQYLKSDEKPQRRALSLSSMVSQEVFMVISASLRASGGP